MELVQLFMNWAHVCKMTIEAAAMTELSLYPLFMWKVWFVAVLIRTISWRVSKGLFIWEWEWDGSSLAETWTWGSLSTGGAAGRGAAGEATNELGVLRNKFQTLSLWSLMYHASRLSRTSLTLSIMVRVPRVWWNDLEEWVAARVLQRVTTQDRRLLQIHWGCK